jgi:16S rRNA C1402 (ribose-2'-O) methylase RsmI
MELLNGFKNLKDVANQRVTGDLIPVVTDAVDAVISEHNKVTDDMLRLFTTRTTQYKIKYKQMGAAKLRPLDHMGGAF